jgi:hypothetical protein
VESSSFPNLLLVLDVQGFDVPDGIGIFIDASIRSEETHSGNACYRFADPLFLILEGFIDEILCLAVAVEIVADKVEVAVVNNGADQGPESTFVSKFAGLDAIEHLQQFGIDLVVAVELD